jgi:flagellar hook-associated protein 2
MPSVDGIVSGINTSALIKGIVDVAAIPQRIMEAQKAEWENKLEKVAGFGNRLSSLSSKIKEIWAEADFQSYTAKANKEGQFTATAGRDVRPGIYQVQTMRLASTDTEVAAGVSSKTAEGLVGTGTLGVTLAGTTTSVDITATDTLEDIASKLNSVTGVSAYVLNTGEAGTPYKLVVQSEESGATNTLDLDVSGLTGGTEALAFTQKSAAEDAWIQVNGIDLYSKTNSFEGQIPGLDIESTEVGTAPIQVTVARDETAMLEKVKSFITAYNDVVTYYKTNTAFDKDKGIKGALIGDGTARRVMGSLGDMVSGAYTGVLSSGSQSQISLGMAGIATQRDGTLLLDEEDFKAALTKDPSKVMAIFSGQNKVSKTFASPTATVGTGTITLKANGLQQEITIDGSNNTLEGVAAALNSAGARARVVQDGTQYRLYVTDETTGSIEELELETDIDLGLSDNKGPLGKIADTIDDAFVDTTNGTVEARKDGIQSTIDELGKSIEAFQTRMDQYTARLRARFTAMEVALGQLQTTSSAVTAMFNSATSSSK